MTDSSRGYTFFRAIDLPHDIARQRVLDERAAAEFVGLSSVTLERMRKLGVAPKHLVLSPRRLGYRICDIIAWLDERALDSGEAV
jgi:predicted DNA-binding transcriptional regulator AlpA